ncbi:MAG: hypothetical protein PHQ86_06420, partial [Dehalococcoidales bacterium]|nr:hypothetical protein [Dehalococcoidales bacterium]
MRERIAKILFQDDIIHGHLQHWESPTADWGKASKNLKLAYYDFADSILKEITEGLTEIFYCEHKEKCQWQGFALYRGYAIGKLENTLLAWREAHQHYCGGELIKGFILPSTT